MRKAVVFGLLFVVLMMTFGVSGVALADRSLSVEHPTPFASTPDTDTETDDDRTIFGERIDGDVESARDVVVTDGSRILGDIEAEGDATIIDSSVDGDVEADGDVTVKGSTVNGDVEADGDIVIEADSRILGDAEAEGDATITDSSVDGDVEAGGSARIIAAIINEDIDAEGTVELADGSRIKGDVDAGADVIISKHSEVGGEIDADGDVIDEDGQAAPELLDLSIAGQGAEATITEGTSEGLGVEVENVGDAPGSFDVTLAIGDTLGVTENTDELAAGETETVTFPDVTGGLVADGYTVDVSTANDTVTGTLEIQTDEQEDDSVDDDQERDSDDEGDEDEQESDGEDGGDKDEQESGGEDGDNDNGGDNDEQESGGEDGDNHNGGDEDEQESDDDDGDREDGGDEGEQKSGGDKDEREGAFEILTASLSSTVITAGESLQIGLLVENVADGDDTFDVDLFVDGETVNSASVTIEADETETIVFSYQFDDPGEYEIAVGDRPLDTVTVTPADEDESEIKRSGDDATAIGIVQATVPADWVREGYETSVRVTVENTANRTANRTLTVTIDDQPVANETVTLQPHERDEVTIEFEATAGSVAVEDVDAGWIHTSVTGAEDDSEEEDTEEGAGFGFEVGIAAFLVIVGILAGVAVLKPQESPTARSSHAQSGLRARQFLNETWCGFTYEDNRDDDEFEAWIAKRSSTRITTLPEMWRGLLSRTGSSVVLAGLSVN